VNSCAAPKRYGDGLVLLVVGTAATPFRTPGPAPGVPVVLVDSGAPDVPDGADVVRIGEDVGRGAAVNRAVATLPTDVGLVATAPADLDWPGGTLDTLRAAADRYPRAGILAPRVLDPDGAPVPSAHPLPRSRFRLPAPSALPEVEGPVGWSSAPALLLRRAALDSVDGFDPRYPGRFDDLDLAARLARAGWLTVHVPAAVVTYQPTDRPDPAAPRRYLADRAPRPVRGLLRPSVRS
jgi:N-acetylglucosaminyl-diphospho-decaprenol L-rhamnosyltransferase